MSHPWKEKRVALLFGGEGSEREVSLKTGAAFQRALEALEIDAVALDFSDAAIVTLATERFDAALIALHGAIGEGGPVQGLLECLQIPYTGSGLLASSLAIDKAATKRALQSAGVATPPWFEVRAADDPRLRGVARSVVVKPPREGSSVGISIVHDPAALPEAVALALRYDDVAMVEDFVPSRELSVGIFDGEVLGVMEIAPASGVYDYEAKYLRDDTQYLLPAPLDADTRVAVEALALAAWHAVGCRGVGRVDVLLHSDGSPWVLELNTVPGMTTTSIVPKMAQAQGIPFEDFVRRMLDAARTDLGRRATP